MAYSNVCLSVLFPVPVCPLLLRKIYESVCYCHIYNLFYFQELACRIPVFRLPVPTYRYILYIFQEHFPQGIYHKAQLLRLNIWQVPVFFVFHRSIPYPGSFYDMPVSLPQE